ncbi:MAG: L-2-hydroxyglutarate oxidase [Gemmataceae bacterium]|nr:L-2-hydroxyglutarate oxidase [Gemmataceae bacterium]
MTIIGGGILGMATALALCERSAANVTVLEAEDALGRHQTGHNSGVIHSGLYYKPGSHKARNCVAGRDALYRFCAEHGIPHERCGKIVVALDRRELPALAELERRGMANGLQNLRRLKAEELRDFEPHARGLAGLHVPETGIVDYKKVLAKYAELVQAKGGALRLGARVRAVRTMPDAVVAEHAQGETKSRFLVNCGGLQSDRIARMCGLEPGLKIIPFRGEYYELASDKKHLVKNLIYPVPDPRFPFLGVHFTRRIDGTIEAGPNAVMALKREGYSWRSVSVRDLWEMGTYGGLWNMAAKYWRIGMGELHRSLSKAAFHRALQRLVPDLACDDLHPAGAGVRAQAVEPSGALVDDFRFVQTPRMIHVLNAPSPGATASLAIGRTIADMAVKQFGLRETSGGL